MTREEVRKKLDDFERRAKIIALEKVKAEMQNLYHIERDTFDKVVRLDKLNNAIDNHIKELKGE